MILGILAGLAAAFLQSLSYLFSRGYVMRNHGSPIQLVLVSQVFMAVACLPVLIIAHTPDVPPLEQYLLPLISATAFYIVGQASIFYVMKELQASRIAPMLGFKIVILAIISALFLDVTIHPRQWLGVIVGTISVVMLNFSGVRISLKSSLAILIACVGYSLSDLSIKQLIESLKPLSTIHASIYATSSSYLLCGLLSLAVVLPHRVPALFKGFQFSIPYAASWLLGMFALFLCFGSVGPVLGNILQSSRGIISILIAIPAAAIGFSAIEPHVPGKILALRITAALLVVIAVWLYASGL